MEKARVLRYITWDLESHLIKPGGLVPKMVCLSAAERGPTGITTNLWLAADGIHHLYRWLLDDDVTLIGHNHPFDLAVAAAYDSSIGKQIFRKFEKGLLLDTITRQQLIDIAEGQAKYFMDPETGEFLKSSYTLADLSYRLNKRYVKKGNDTWRLRYALLDGVPIAGWPEDARKYAIDDAEITLEVFEAQERIIEKADWTFNADLKRHVLANQREQHQAAWALYLQSVWGIRTDGEAVAVLKSELQTEYDEIIDKLRPSGLLNIEPPRVLKSGPRKGMLKPEEISKSMKAIYAQVEHCFRAKGEPVPLTDGGRTATDRKTLEATGDPSLKLVAQAGAVQKLLTTYVPVLEGGINHPVCCRYNVLVESGRTSCSKPNLQNPPQKGGVRECFVARPGWVLGFCDFDTLELRSLAQVCLDLFGESEMAEALRRGEDLHLSLAAGELLHIPLEEAQKRLKAGDPEVKEMRQKAKVANFGFPGGMGWEGFKEYAEGFKLIITDDQAKELRDGWFRRWPEMRKYFEFIGRLTEHSDQLTQLRSGRVRGGANFCSAANSFFQGLAADGAKEALWQVAKECYLEDPEGVGLGPTPLYGCRPVLFLHDEIAIEIPYDDPVCASAAADRLSEVMIKAMAKWIDGVPITCKPVMCRRWYKGAEAVRIDGVLVPSRPVKDGKRTVWVADGFAATSSAA